MISTICKAKSKGKSKNSCKGKSSCGAKKKKNDLNHVTAPVLFWGKRSVNFLVKRKRSFFYRNVGVVACRGVYCASYFNCV